MKLKFISLNLWWGGYLFPQILDFLREQNADIVVLQEAHDGSGNIPDRFRSMEVLKQSLAYPYQRFALSHKMSLPEGTFPSGNAMLSKYPIIDHSITYLFDSKRDTYRDVREEWSILPRILQGATLETPAGSVNVFNIHGVWDLDGDNPTPARRTMIERTLKAIAGKPNVLLAGDTNASTGNPVLRDLEKQLTSVFGESLRSTFNMRRKDNPGYATAAVDHMYVSPNIKVLSRECPDIDISDHRPLIAKLEIPES